MTTRENVREALTMLPDRLSVDDALSVVDRYVESHNPHRKSVAEVIGSTVGLLGFFGLVAFAIWVMRG